MRKHSTWLWSIIIIVVVFAFVIWGTNPRNRGSGRAGIYGRINGQPVTEEDKVAAEKEVNLRYFFRFGEWPGIKAERMGFDMQRQIFSLLLLNQILKERGIHAGSDAKAAVIGTLLRNMRSKGIKTLADFQREVLQRQGLTLADLDRFFEHQIAMRQLTAVEGLPGQLVSPQQVESLWKRDNQEISALVVFFCASNYLESVEVAPEAVAAYFTNQMARYRIPERVQVSYVAYPISNYLAQADEQLASVTNLDAQIDSLYRQRGTNFYADVTPAEAKEQIREEARLQAATFAARQDAAAFADDLWRQEPMKPSDLRELAARDGLKVATTEPFDRDSTPTGLDVNLTFTDMAFHLREDEPHAGPINGEDHVYVITMDRRMPSRIARFEDVKDEVTEDYRWQQATLKARELGRSLSADLTNSVALGKDFTEVCADAGYKPLRLTRFSRITRSQPEVEAHTSLPLFKQVAFATPEGQTSRFTLTTDGGYVVHVSRRLPVDELRMKEELPRYADYVRQTLEDEAFRLWLNREEQVGLRETPVSQTPPPQLSPSGS